MLFIDNPQYLPDPNLRRQFYLQLRQDVLTKQIKIASKQAIKLMAYGLQAEYGDFVDFETTAHMWRERPMVSAALTGGPVELGCLEHIDDIIWGYCQLRGVSQDNAIWYYLDEIRRLSSYGVQLFYGSTVSGEAAQLGVSRNGLAISTISPANPAVSKHKWEDIKDLAYSRKTFTIQLLKKGKPIHFVFEDPQDARYLWNFCIQMHNSYIHYWTHVKTGQTAHVSGPPDLLRGNGFTLSTPTSSPSYDFGGTSPQFSSKGGSDTSGVVVNNSNSTTTVGSVNSMHATIGQVGNNSLTSLQQSHTNHPVSSSLPVCGSTGAEHDASRSHEQSGLAMALAYSTQQEDSEGGTLVDTMDSQMLANRCVACLPVTSCLRRGTTPKSSDPCSSSTGGHKQPTQIKSPSPTPPRKRHHHHHRKHRLQSMPLSGVAQGATNAQEVAARYNMSLAESSSGSSSESEFESDVCSTSAETSSSSNSSRRGDEDVDMQEQQHGFQRMLGSKPTGTGNSVSLRPILSTFSQRHYRLQQNWRDESCINAGGDNAGTSPSRQFGGSSNGSGEVKNFPGESHGWLASAKRLTSALSESLTRRALSSNPSSTKPSPSATPQFLSRGPKSIGIAQVIRPEPPSTSSNPASIEGFDEGRRRPSRPPIPPSGGVASSSRHPPMGFNPNAPQRGASAGPATTGTTPPNMVGALPSYPLHHSLYEASPESRLQIRLQPPSPPSSQEEASWRLVQNPGPWLNQPQGQSQQRHQACFEGGLTNSAQQVMTSSSMTSSSTSTSTSSAGVVAAVGAAAANSSSPSSPASSIVEDEIMIMMRGDKEDDSSSTMSYSACGGTGSGQGQGQPNGKTAAVVAPIQKQTPPPTSAQHQQRQRSLSGSGGPLHLLTNSDIHQLLNLTKMRETALVHRLLAEYRQTLLLQQSLHTNSMSTPNLAASQELHAPTNANGVSDGSGNGGGSGGGGGGSGGLSSFNNGNYSSALGAANGCGVQQRSGTQKRGELGGNSGMQNESSCGYRGYNGSRCGAHGARGHHMSDSSDYVNACAFQCQHNSNCAAAASHMQTSVHSTTDNDSNATFRVLSEVDGVRSHFSNSRHQQQQQQQANQSHGRDHSHHHGHHHHHHHHEDSCTMVSDLMSSSNCLQKAWNPLVAKSNSFHHQAQRHGGGSGSEGSGGDGGSSGMSRTRHPHEMYKSATPDGFRRQGNCTGPLKSGETMSGEVMERGNSDNSVNSGGEAHPANGGGGFGRSKTFAASGSAGAHNSANRVSFAHAYDGSGGSGHLHVGEYENLENDSPLLSSGNRKSNTDISVRSSSSDVSYEDYKFDHRLQRQNRTPKLTSSGKFGDSHERHQHCPHRSHRNCHLVRPLVSASSNSKRSTLPNISCDGGGGHIQLCLDHLRALEQLGAPKEVHIDTPVIQRRNQKKRSQKVKTSCCSYCSAPQTNRYVEKTRTFDSYQQQKSSIRHRCSASPVFSIEPVESQCDLCRRQRRWKVDYGRPRCGCENLGGSGDLDGDSDEFEGDEDDLDEEVERFSSSRAASDSSLASSAVPGTRDTTSIMVSSYEFECQQSHNVGSSSLDSNSGAGGATPQRCKNKPPTPKFKEERRGSSSRLQSHVNFFEGRQCSQAKSGRPSQSSSRKTSVSPPMMERVVPRLERPKTLLTSSLAPFQTDEHHHRHQPETPSLCYSNRPMGGGGGGCGGGGMNSRDGTPIRRTGSGGNSSGKGTSYSRTPTPARSIGSQQTGVMTPGGNGGGIVFTASMTFTPSTNSSATLSPGAQNAMLMARGATPDRGQQYQLQQKQQQQQSDFNRCMGYKSASFRDKEEASYPFPKRALTPSENRRTNITP